METNKKVILELYMDVWYCYEYDNGSMADPLFTSTSQKLATDEAESEGYEVVQVIDMSYLDEEGNEIPLYLQNDKTKVDSNDFLIAENAALKESNEVLLDALKPLANLDLEGVNQQVCGNIVYQRNNTMITVFDVQKAKEIITKAESTKA